MHRQTALGLSDKNLFPTNGSHEESKLEVNGNGDFEHQAKKEEETEMKARVYLDRKHSKIDKLIVNLLKKYAFVDDVVAISVCEFSAALSHNHSSNQAILGTQGICEELVNLLRCHGAVCNVERRLQLLEHALSALANLGNDELNLHKMIRCGACEIVIELLQTNCLDRSSSVVLTDIRPCIVVITHGFDSLSLFAGAGDQALERLQGADAPRVLIALLRVYCLEQDTLNVSVLAASGLSCIANMASSYQLSWLLFQLGACQLVLHVLQTWGSTSPSVVENGFVAIKALSALSCNRNEFVQLNAISDVLKFQEIGGAEQDLAIATAALEAFAELTSTAALNYCGKQNQASVVVNQPKLEIFQEDTKEKDQRKKSALLAVKLMRKASKIFDQQAQNNDLSVEVKGTDEHYQLIFSLLRKHGTCNVQIALAALKAFTNITSGDQEGKEQLDLLSRWGGCGLVLDLLNAHGSRNTAVAEYFAKVVNILAREEPNTLQLVQAGMYEVCLDLLRAYTALQHGSIILECVKALLTFFPRRSLSNLNGGDPLACHLLATVLQRYCSDHTQLDLLSHTLLAIQLVTFYQPNKSYFGCEEMACETIVVVLATHCFENVELTVVTLCSAANIAVVSSVAQQLATAGICDLLVDLLHTHRSYSVAEQGLRLLACLATVGKSVNRFNSENSGTVGKSGKIDSALAVNYQQLLGDLGACELVVKLMRTHLTNGTTAVHGEGVALQGSVAIHNLCNACCANKQRFLVEKAPELLQLVLSDRLLSQISRAEIVDAIKAIRY